MIFIGTNVMRNYVLDGVCGGRLIRCLVHYTLYVN
jgi:hypothetical protein